MFFLKPTVLKILVLIATPIIGDRYGYPCSADWACQTGKPGWIRDALQCKNGTCEYVPWTKDFGMGGGPKCKGPLYEECGPNSKCVIGQNQWNPWLPDNRCVCNKGYRMVSDECREVRKNASLGEFCGTPIIGPITECDNKNGNRECRNNKCSCVSYLYLDPDPDPDADACITKTEYIEKYKANFIVELFEPCDDNYEYNWPKYCDDAANMTCIDSKCQCNRYSYYDANNGTSLECKSKKSFAEEHNMTVYRGMPGMYCHKYYDCIEGLTCENYYCCCPYPCEFVYDKLACDCGKVSATEGAGRPILVGIIGGIVIIFGWCHLIKKQIKKTKGGNYTEASAEGENYIQPPYNPQASAPCTPPTYQQPTAVPTDSITVPLIYQTPTSFPDATNPSAPYPDAPSQPDVSYPSAPYIGSPYSSAASQPSAPPQPSGPAGTSTGVPTDPPPAYSSIYPDSTAN